MLRFDNLSFGYEGRARLFRNLSLHIGEHENVLLKGENGCGKSTLLKLIMGILKPIAGEILIAGKPLPQQLSGLFAHLFYQSQNTADNLLGISQKQDWQMWQLALPGLGDNPTDMLFSERSTGEQKQDAQRILPYLRDKFWLLDEPFASLDSSASDRLFMLISQKMKEQPGMLVVAHDFRERENSFDRILLLESGVLSEIRHA